MVHMIMTVRILGNKIVTRNVRHFFSVFFFYHSKYQKICRKRTSYA